MDKLNCFTIYSLLIVVTQCLVLVFFLKKRDGVFIYSFASMLCYFLAIVLYVNDIKTLLYTYVFTTLLSFLIASVVLLKSKNTEQKPIPNHESDIFSGKNNFILTFWVGISVCLAFIGFLFGAYSRKILPIPYISSGWDIFIKFYYLLTPFFSIFTVWKLSFNKVSGLKMTFLLSKNNPNNIIYVLTKWIGLQTSIFKKSFILAGLTNLWFVGILFGFTNTFFDGVIINRADEEAIAVFALFTAIAIFTTIVTIIAEIPLIIENTSQDLSEDKLYE